MTRECEILIGLVSDTHGMLRPALLERLAGVDMILHAGDVGAPEIPGRLAALAPCFAVRGNNDPRFWGLPLRETVQAAGDLIYLVHEIRDLDIVPAACGVSVVVSGHTHQWACEEKRGVLYVNPGAAGPRRFHCPVSMGLLKKQGGVWTFEPVILESS